MLVLLILIIFLFSGCSAHDENLVPVPDLNFIGNISVTYNNFNMTCEIENYLADKCTITVVKPELLSGLVVVLKDGVCTLELGDISYELNEQFLTKTEFVSLFSSSLKKVLETAEYEKMENGNILFTGISEKGKFFLLQDSVTGYPVSFRIPQAGLIIKFSDMKSL